MKRVMIVASMAISAFAATAVQPTAATAQTVFNYSSFIPWQHPLNLALYVKWIEQVEKATDGRVKFRRLPKPVASPPAHFNAVRTGQADAAFAVHDYQPGLFYMYSFAQLPFGGEDAVATSVALWRTHAKFFDEAKIYRGVKLIGVNTHGPGQIFHRTKFIKMPSDMKGQKMRVGGPIPRAVVAAWGGVPVRQPVTKSYELLSTGVVDGITFPWESVPSFRITNLVPFATLIPGGLYSSTHFFFISSRKYASLAPADKKVIDDRSGEAFARLAGGAWNSVNKKGEETAVAAGTKMLVAPKPVIDAVKKLNVKFEADYAARVKKAGIDGAAVIKFYKEQVTALSK